MDELIKTFHIDYKLIVAQLINFVIVVGVLWYFAFKPLTKKMNKRTNAIEKGLEDAKKVEENLAKAEELKDEKLAAARAEAEKIITEAQKISEANRQEVIEKTKKETEKIVGEAKNQISAEREKLQKELKGEVADMVVAATEKVITEVLDSEKDKGLIKKALEKIKL